MQYEQKEVDILESTVYGEGKNLFSTGLQALSGHHAESKDGDPGSPAHLRVEPI